jgi:hypothetical protein
MKQFTQRAAMELREVPTSNILVTKEVNPDAAQRQRYNWLKGMKQKNLKRNNLFAKERPSNTLGVSRKSSQLDQAFFAEHQVQFRSKDIGFSTSTMSKNDYESLSPMSQRPFKSKAQKLPSIRNSTDKEDSIFFQKKKKKKAKAKKVEDSMHFYIGHDSKLAPLSQKAKKNGV